jgi:hypothetical protein
MGRPVTLFTGQWADLPLDTLCKNVKDFGYDGLELASWDDDFEIEVSIGAMLGSPNGTHPDCNAAEATSLVFRPKTRGLGNGRAIYIPEIPVGLGVASAASQGGGPPDWRFINMRIDTGADYTLLDRALAPSLGCRLHGAPSATVRIPNGQEFSVVLSQARLRLVDIRLQVATWTTTIAFGQGVRTPLLGVSGCLELFDLRLESTQIVFMPREPFPGLMGTAA